MFHRIFKYIKRNTFFYHKMQILEKINFSSKTVFFFRCIQSPDEYRKKIQTIFKSTTTRLHNEHI